MCEFCDKNYENDDFDYIEYASGIDEENCGKVIDFTSVQDVVNKRLIVIADSGFDIPFPVVVKENNCIKCGRRL